MEPQSEIKSYKPNPWKIWFTILTVMMPISIIAAAGYIFAITVVLPTGEAAKAALNPNAAVTEKVSVDPTNPAAFDSLSLEAKAVYVIDEKQSRVLFAKNEEAQLPLASLTKIMTALAATEILPDYTTITVPAAVVKSQPNSGLAANEQWRLSDLMNFTLTMSSNAGADSIAGAAGAVLLGRDQNGGGSVFQSSKTAFVDYINARAKSLGLSQTYFINSTGLDQNADISGGYGSAKDVATLFNYVLTKHPDLFDATRYPAVSVESLDGKKHLAVNTDSVIKDIPGLIASKTGLTDLAGGNLVVAFDAAFGHSIVAVVMGSTEQGRFLDMKKLVAATFKSFSGSE